MITYTCTNPRDEICADNQAIQSATAYWDVDAQEWKLSDDMEGIACGNCGGAMEEVVTEPESLKLLRKVRACLMQGWDGHQIIDDVDAGIAREMGEAPAC